MLLLSDEHLLATIYIAGPMTGHDNFNYDRFHEVEKTLRDKGFLHVENPARHFDGRQDMTWNAYLQAAIEAVIRSDIIVALPGWNESTGARLEVAIGMAIGMPIYEYVDEIVGRRAMFVPVTVTDSRQAVAAIMGMGHATFIEDDPVLVDTPPHEEAAKLVHGARQDNYGHPLDNFTGTAGIWNGILHKKLSAPLTAEDIGLCMVGVKLSRETHVPKRDNLVDAHGYLMTYQMVKDERTRRGIDS